MQLNVAPRPRLPLNIIICFTIIITEPVVVAATAQAQTASTTASKIPIPALVAATPKGKPPPTPHHARSHRMKQSQPLESLPENRDGASGSALPMPMTVIGVTSGTHTAHHTSIPHVTQKQCKLQLSALAYAIVNLLARLRLLQAVQAIPASNCCWLRCCRWTVKRRHGSLFSTNLSLNQLRL